MGKPNRENLGYLRANKIALRGKRGCVSWRSAAGTPCGILLPPINKVKSRERDHQHDVAGLMKRERTPGYSAL
jgi:hypothetical protein